MRITCVIPATNRPDTLERCLAAVRAASDGPEELIPITEPAAAGPAEARNTGAGEGAGDVLVFVDADVVVHPDAFTRIRGAFGADPSLVAVFGAYDEKAGAVGSLWDVVRDRRLNHRPEVIGGVLADESARLLDRFFAAHRDFGRTDDVR